MKQIFNKAFFYYDLALQSSLKNERFIQEKHSIYSGSLDGCVHPMTRGIVKKNYCIINIINESKK